MSHLITDTFSRKDNNRINAIRPGRGDASFSGPPIPLPRRKEALARSN
jgi:hypothetical protein